MESGINTSSVGYLPGSPWKRTGQITPLWVRFSLLSRSRKVRHSAMHQLLLKYMFDQTGTRQGDPSRARWMVPESFSP